MPFPTIITKSKDGRAVIAYKQHRRAAYESVAKLQQLAETIGNYPASIDEARDACIKNPSKANAERWLALEANREAAFRMNQQLTGSLSALRDSALLDGGAEKIVAACDEIEAALDARWDQIEKEDALRSEELGVSVSSPEAFQSIDRMRRTLADARGYRKSNFAMAAGSLQTLIGTD